MGRFLMLIGIVLIINFSWPTIKSQLDNPAQSIDRVQSEVVALATNPEVADAAKGLLDRFKEFFQQAGILVEEIRNEQKKPEPLEKVDLAVPQQLFSIYNIELGDDLTEVEKQLGKPKRTSKNEYGTSWNAYHDQYRQFVMVMYDESNKVSGLYTNQDLIASSVGIKLGTPKADVRKKMGDPLSTMQRGKTIYRLQDNQEHDLFHENGAYITIFYDKHEGNTVTALQVVRKELEERKTDLYTAGSEGLREGFEYQMFDLTNSTRLVHGLPTLEWDQHVRETARKHSADMAANNYFDHTNLEGQSPFDRMEEDDVKFMLAGENLAYGQFSSIFAHEGLMNSLGHRENILRAGYEYLGVGVAFNDKSQPYYTQNYFAD